MAGTVKDAVIQRIYPAIVVFPQCPKESYWASVKRDYEVSLEKKYNYAKSLPKNSQLEIVESLMVFLEKNYKIDTTRCYVGGLSMGGMGTYELISRRPELFAAAFAICGGADPVIAEKYPEGFDIWIFHGEKDDVVPVELSKTMAREINAHGGNAKLSLYPEADHNSWNAAFREPYLLPWLFRQSKNQKL